MATYFVSNGTIVGAPNDSNDGLDALGIELLNAAYTDTGGAGGSYRIQLGGFFTDYTWTAGDQIYLTGPVITNGLYEIASRQDADVIFLTESAGGDDTIASSDGPLATIQAGVDATEAGDELIICGASTYAEATQIDFDTNATTVLDFARYTGATARGVVDGTRATIDFDTQSSGNGFSMASNVAYAALAHLDIRNSAGHNVFLDLSCVWTFENCRITGAGASGINLDAAATHIMLYGCEIDNNTVDGILLGYATRGPVGCFDCSIHDNGVVGAWFAVEACTFEGCRIYDNGGNGIERVASASHAVRNSFTVRGCTVFGNGGHGIDLTDTSTGRAILTDNVIRSNTTYGIYCAGDADAVYINSHNCIHNNGSGASDVTLPGGVGNIYVDPEFESEVDGSEDFEPDSDSPLIGAGCSYTIGGGTQYLDIGAIQREMAVGGGGGLLTHPGMVGGMRG